MLQVSFYAHPFEQIARYAAHQQQPPLDYWIGYGVSFFSSSDFALRLPSVFFGVGTVFFITLLVRNLCSLPVAYGAGILGALLPFAIHFSQEARPYAIATSLFLALLWAVARLLSTSERAREKILILFLISTAFLHSRGFEPLVITALLIFILTVRLAYSILCHGIVRNGPQRAALYSAATLGLALVLYLPTFKTLLACGDSYLSKASGFLSLATLLAGIEDFSLRPLIMSFAFQTEPLTYFLLTLLFLSPFLAWRRGLWRTHEVYALALVLLPGISLLHLFIFQTYTDANFKPQYAFYLLPLTLILCSAAFQGLWAMTGPLKKARILRALLLVLAAFMVLCTVNSAWTYKTFKKKEDWKGLCRHLAEAYGPGQILLFDTLVPYGSWEGNFYGFRRYYEGNSQRLVLAQIPSLCPEMVRMDKEPVLILYHRADLCLTPRSLYCRFLPPERRSDYISKEAFAFEPRLSMSAFTGFHVMTLKEKTSNTAVDAYTLLSRTTSLLPGDQSLIDLYLASAGLARALGLPEWEKHLLTAETLATQDQRLKMSSVIRAIRGMPATKDIKE